MINQPQVNIKRLPPNPTAEDLYKFHYNRETRRKHSAAKKQELKAKLWANYQQYLLEIARLQKGGAKDGENK